MYQRTLIGLSEGPLSLAFDSVGLSAFRPAPHRCLTWPVRGLVALVRRCFPPFLAHVLASDPSGAVNNYECQKAVVRAAGLKRLTGAKQLGAVPYCRPVH